MMKPRLIAAAFAALLLIARIAIAQGPARNVSGARHPNLAAVQQANEWDLAGHAHKAKDLLDQPNNELKQAAQAANRNHR